MNRMPWREMTNIEGVFTKQSLGTEPFQQLQPDGY